MRMKDGSTVPLDETFSPFLWNTTEGEALAGDLPLSHLLRFDDSGSHSGGQDAPENGSHL